MPLLNDIDNRMAANLCFVFYERFAEKADRSEKEKNTMASNKSQAKEALQRFKMEAANEVGVNLKQGYNGDITAKDAGSVGGQMVKKMIESYENNLSK